MKQNRLNKFIAKLTGKKQQKYVDLRSFIKSSELVEEEHPLNSSTYQRLYLELDAWDVIEARKHSEGFAKTYVLEANEFYHQRRVMEFGFYPQRVEIDSWEVEELMEPKATGRSYYRYNQSCYMHTIQPEFRLSNGKRVVRERNYHLKEKNNVTTYIGDKENKYRYYENTPVKWEVVNYDHLSPLLNPKGDGTESSIRLRCTNLYDSKSKFEQEAFVVAPELLKLSGVKNIDNLIRMSKQEECEKVL